MKKLSQTLLLLLLASTVFAQVQKHALIIAIGDYPSESGWNKISSVNDIPLVRGAYEKQGFDNFIVVQDSAATLKGILASFTSLSKSVKEGDIVAIHISSHGQQIYDDGNKDEIDGYDEAIVMYGANAEFSDTYRGELHLRDEHFGALVDNIRGILGPKGDILITIDACHSGTATRGEGKPRGGVAPLAPYHYKPETKDKNEVGMFEKNYPFSRGADAPKLSPMVVISAARANELNYEFEGKGSLSLALSRSMNNLGTNYSYRTLFSKIMKEMSIIAPRQSPALEGDVDRKLFGGKVVQQESYYKITELNYDAIRIDGGVYTGLNEGSTFEIYPAGTISTDKETPVMNGSVTYAEGFACNGTLDGELKGNPNEYWLFVKEKSYGDRTVWLRLGKDLSKSEKKSISEQLASSALIKLADKNQKAEFELSTNGRGLNEIRRITDGSTYKENIRPGDVRTVKKALVAYAQGKFVKEMEIDNPDYNVELELIPFKMVEGKVDTLALGNIQDEGGIPVFTEDVQAFIKITNHGDFDIYFNIVDIQPDGVINPLIPNPRKNEDPKEFKIEAGKSFTLPRNRKVSFAPPYGLETFKIFASYQPINLAPIITTRGAPAGASTPIETLFRSGYSMSRGASVGSMPTDTDAATFSYIFKIAPNK